MDFEKVLGAIKRTKGENLKKYNDYYNGEHEIKNRFSAAGGVYNHVIVNHAKYITDLFTGNLLGKQVEFNDVKGGDTTVLEDLYRTLGIAVHDYGVGKNSSIYGKSYEYTFAYNSQPRLAIISPENATIVRDDSFLHLPEYGVVWDTDSVGSVTKIVVMTDKKILTFDENGKELSSKKHYFGGVPLVEFKNNDRMIGDFKAVMSAIDAYNMWMSDSVNEKEKLAEAILLLKGFKLYDENMTAEEKNEKMALFRRERMLELPDAESSAEYLIKGVDERATDVVRTALKEDIHKISMTPDMTDNNFAGNASGIAIQYKTTNFETATKEKERNFEKGLLERLRLWENYYTKKGEKFVDVNNLDVIFNRSLPQNDLDNANVVAMLNGIIKPEILASRMSFVKNGKEAILEGAEDKDKNNLDTPLDTTAPVVVPKSVGETRR